MEVDLTFSFLAETVGDCEASGAGAYNDKVILFVDFVLALDHGAAGVRGSSGCEAQERRGEKGPEAHG